MKKETDALGIVSLVIGILSLLLFPILLGITAIGFGASSKQKSGFSTAGIVMGIFSIIYGIIRLGF